MNKKNILLLGAGNMVSALFGPLKNSPYHFYVFTPSGEKAKNLASHLNGTWVEKLSDLKGKLSEDPDFFEMVFLGYKPQMFDRASNDFLLETGFESKETTVVSMLAGTPLKVLSHKFHTSNVIRIMPNTPSLKGLGVTLVLPNEEVREERSHLLEEILRPSSVFHQCENEDQLDQITAITGSGPAYVFEFARLMKDYLKNIGVNENHASLLVGQLFKGSSEMLMQSEDDFETLRNKVTSPNGVTYEALETFKKNGLGDIFNQAFEKNFRRSLELREEALKMEQKK